MSSTPTDPQGFARGKDRSRALRSAVWFLGLFLAWPIIAQLAHAVGFALAESLPDTGWVDWSEIVAFAVEGLAAYVVVVGLARVGAPRHAWLAIATAEIPRVVLFALGLALLAAGRHAPWSDHWLFSSYGTQTPLAVAQQLTQFIGWWAWGVVFPIVGGWLGSRAPRAS